jgi:4-hydroxybenzoyl-CoA thioesterase
MIEPTRIDVTFGDCDPAGIVFYPNIFRWMDRTFHDALRPLGGHGAVAEALGALGLGAMESRGQFRRPIRDGDTVAIHLTIAEWGRRSVTLEYQGIRNGETVMIGSEVRGVFMHSGDGIVAGEVAGLRKMLESRTDG